MSKQYLPVVMFNIMNVYNYYLRMCLFQNKQNSKSTYNNIHLYSVYNHNKKLIQFNMNILLYMY